MYGVGLIKGLGVTFKNLILPGRQFTIHQYPDRKIGPIGLARMEGKNPLAFALSRPGKIGQCYPSRTRSGRFRECSTPCRV